MDMLPKGSPQVLGRSGGRRVNNLPLFLAGGAFVMFALIIALVAMDRAARQRAETTPQPVATNATSFAKEIIGDNHGGFVPPATPPELPKEKEPDRELKVPIARADDPLKPPPPPEKNVRNPAEEDAERIRQAKLQALEQAVKAKTTIPVTDFRSKAAMGPPYGAPHQSDDPLSVYKAALAEIQGAGLGPRAEAIPRNDLRQFTGVGQGDRWRLDSKPEPPRTRYELRAGFVIPATMISGINSDLPGQIIGQVSENVFDTPTGKHLLIPQGSRLVGTYSSDVAFGQQRVLVAWQRIIFPDGKAMDIAAMPGADGAGFAGFKDKINNHYFRTFGSALLMSGIIAGVNLSQDRSSNPTENTQRSSDALSEALGQNLGSTMAQMISKNLNVSPTLEIRPGYRFNVMVVKDLTFTRSYRSFDYAQRRGGVS